MSKLFEAINKARTAGDAAPTVVDNKTNGSGPAITTESAADVVPATRSPRPRREAGPEFIASPPPASIATQGEPGAARAQTQTQTDRHDAPEEHMVSLVDPHSFEAEQFRALRHIVEQRQRDAGLRLVAVTSAAEGDGKSLVSVNLAGALAQNQDARVLLIDSDLRAPAINRCLGLRGSPPGLADIVSSATLDLDEVTIARSTYNLAVVTAGTRPASPYEVLKSERFASLIAEARSLYDIIVIDTPPVLTFPDTRIIEHHVDGFVLVVGAHKTPRKLVDEAVDSISEDKLLGLVFNGEDEPKRYAASAYYGHAGARRKFWGKRRR